MNSLVVGGGCADEPIETFGGMLYAWRESIALLQGENIGEELFPGIHGLDAIDRTDGAERMRRLAGRFGSEER